MTRASYFTALNAPTLLPYFAIGQFLFGHAVLSTRGPKVALGELFFLLADIVVMASRADRLASVFAGIDHNVNVRS